ncbi:hypothetical protein FQA39_LY15983 [Lamprigera yunnana]|nr:hypothetical protein FQA39_LY15983 [Lamprigera yunnana]
MNGYNFANNEKTLISTCDMMWKPRQIGSKTLTFEMIEEMKILRIENMGGNEIDLCWKSLSQVWSLETVLKYRLTSSSGCNFKHFFKDVIRTVAEISGDVKINIYNIVDRLSQKSEYVCLDSVSTSCIQLAKERIIKYSDPKYNINHLKTGDCETMLLNQTIYYLNKSKSKWITIGLYYPFEFVSVLKIFGRSKQYVLFKEEEWIQFHEQLENTNKYFQTCDIMWKPRQIGSNILTFEMMEEKKILRIEDMCKNEVYLVWEFVS